MGRKWGAKADRSKDRQTARRKRRRRMVQADPRRSEIKQGGPK